jgi:hypothetical protein
MRKLVSGGSAAMIALAALAACSGGSSTANSTPTTNGGVASPSSQDLSHLVANANKQRVKIAFTLGGGPEQVYEQDGKGNSVLRSGDSETFSTKTNTISCDKISGKSECSVSPGSDESDNPFLGVVTLERSQLSALGGRFGTTSSKTIAGRNAQCVTFSTNDLIGGAGSGPEVAAAATYEYCIDKDTGVTLRVSTTDNSGKQASVLLVTAFGAPKASDFTPPATPTAATLAAG